MARVAILGAGAGGAAAAVELTARGHAVALWNRSASTLEPFRAAGGVRHLGVLGDGFTALDRITTDLAAALDDADVALVCMPSLAHDDVADALAAAGADLPVVLNPGHTGGALHLAARMGEATPPLAELSTLTYVARKVGGDTVRVTGAAGRVRAACLPGADAALDWACELYPVAVRERDVLAADLANVNLVLHPPAAVLGAAWVEATGGAFRFYAEATTPAVARVMASLDDERLAVARAYGHALDSLLDEMAAIGTADPAEAAAGDLRAAIAEGEANRAIMAPESLEHRYYREDFGYGLLPFCELAAIAGVEVPTARALLGLADVFVEGGVVAHGLGAERLGLAGLGLDDLLAKVRPAPAASTTRSDT
ncbi:MAG TPA: NAD/NADP octopine/nopaline dehydrogenase family protein [Capillimicrobium sp.]|nr:NAD/NADP octopine/nopaline dehydrogenase family protein [Capillimicrobium sp.]